MHAFTFSGLHYWHPPFSSNWGSHVMTEHCQKKHRKHASYCYFIPSARHHKLIYSSWLTTLLLSLMAKKINSHYIHNYKSTLKPLRGQNNYFTIEMVTLTSCSVEEIQKLGLKVVLIMRWSWYWCGLCVRFSWICTEQRIWFIMYKLWSIWTMNRPL